MHILWANIKRNVKELLARAPNYKFPSVSLVSKLHSRAADRSVHPGADGNSGDMNFRNLTVTVTVVA
ncbi:MAG: hypothetical protein DMG71_07700 [Acidobacteria bacterium]|nr:MAG: hypothetical protein DMG71_07700 [Acidobacteriota bacterium]